MTSVCLHAVIATMRLRQLRVLLTFAVIGILSSRGVFTQRPLAHANPAPSILEAAANDYDVDRQLLLSFPGANGNAVASQEIGYAAADDNDADVAQWKFVNSAYDRANAALANAIYNYRGEPGLRAAVKASFPSPAMMRRKGNDEMAFGFEMPQKVEDSNSDDDVDELVQMSVSKGEATSKKQKRSEHAAGRRPYGFFSRAEEDAFEPQYAYSFDGASSDGAGGEAARSFWQRLAMRSSKRKPAVAAGNRPESYVPSISNGAMVNLASYFDKLISNVDHSIRTEPSRDTTELLHGADPLRFHKSNWKSAVAAGRHNNNQPSAAKMDEKTANFLHAIRKYRPSERIRSLVAMNPPGYHGSHFIDPNYMWVGLGK